MFRSVVPSCAVHRSVIATSFSILDTFTTPTARTAGSDRQIDLMPNPADDHVQLELVGYAGEAVTVRILSTDGREWQRHTLDVEVERMAVALDLSDLPAGFYRCRVIDSRGATERSLVRSP